MLAALVSHSSGLEPFRKDCAHLGYQAVLRADSREKIGMRHDTFLFLVAALRSAANWLAEPFGTSCGLFCPGAGWPKACASASGSAAGRG